MYFFLFHISESQFYLSTPGANPWIDRLLLTFFPGLITVYTFLQGLTGSSFIVIVLILTISGRMATAQCTEIDVAREGVGWSSDSEPQRADLICLLLVLVKDMNAILRFTHVESVELSCKDSEMPGLGGNLQVPELTLIHKVQLRKWIVTYLTIMKKHTFLNS